MALIASIAWIASVKHLNYRDHLLKRQPDIDSFVDDLENGKLHVTTKQWIEWTKKLHTVEKDEIYVNTTETWLLGVIGKVGLVLVLFNFLVVLKVRKDLNKP